MSEFVSITSAALLVVSASMFSTGCASRDAQMSETPTSVSGADGNGSGCDVSVSLVRTEMGEPAQLGTLGDDVWFVTTGQAESGLFSLATNELEAVGSSISAENDGRLWVVSRRGQQGLRVDAFSDLRDGPEFGDGVCLPDQGCATAVWEIVVEPNNGVAYLLASFHDSPEGSASVLVYDYFSDSLRRALGDVVEPAQMFLDARSGTPTLVMTSAVSSELVGVPTLTLRNIELDPGAVAETLASGDYGMEPSSIDPATDFCGMPNAAFDALGEVTPPADMRHCVQDGDAFVLGRAEDQGLPATAVYRVQCVDAADTSQR